MQRQCAASVMLQYLTNASDSFTPSGGARLPVQYHFLKGLKLFLLVKENLVICVFQCTSCMLFGMAVVTITCLSFFCCIVVDDSAGCIIKVQTILTKLLTFRT